MNNITFEIEDNNGNTLFAFAFDAEHKTIIGTSNCSLADVDGDDIFDTDNPKFRIQADK